MSRLRTVFCPLLAFDGETPLIAAGPLVKEPMSAPFRIVLADQGDQYVVWMECVPNYPDPARANFCHGHYFRKDREDVFTTAVHKFTERVQNYAYSGLETAVAEKVA